MSTNLIQQRIATVIAVTLLVVTLGARAEILHTLQPSPLTESDEVQIELVVPWAHLDSCHFTTHEISQIGNQITIDLTTDRNGEICLPVIGDARVDVPVGPLAPGTYLVTVTHETVGSSSRPERIDFNFQVLPAPPEPLLSSASELTFNTLAGRTYQVMCSSTLSSWAPLGAPIVGDGSPASVPLPGGGTKFFRVEVTMDGGAE